MTQPVCVVVGVGPGNGAAIAHQFSQDGYRVAVLARRQAYVEELAASLKDGKGYVCDVTDSARIREVFRQITQDLGPIETLVFNAGSGKFLSFEETTLEDLESTWQINVRGFFVAAKEVVPAMLEAGRGNIMVIGATASLRGKAKTLPFASAKSAQRIMLQSMARGLGPQGIHVGYVIVDGFVDSGAAREMSPQMQDDDFIKPANVASTVAYLCQQPRSAWTFEITVRPARENW